MHKSNIVHHSLSRFLCVTIHNRHTMISRETFISPFENTPALTRRFSCPSSSTNSLIFLLHFLSSFLTSTRSVIISCLVNSDSRYRLRENAALSSLSIIVATSILELFSLASMLFLSHEFSSAFSYNAIFVDYIVIVFTFTKRLFV